MFTAADQIAAPLCQLVARRAVSLVQLLQAIADLIQILDKQHELVVQPPGSLGDFPRILALTLLFPQAVDDAQRRQQSGRADDHDIAVERLLKQRRLSLQRRGKGRFDRHEQQYEIQAVQAVETFVVLPGQTFNVIAQGQDVLLDGDLADGLVFCGNVLLIRREADLGVDHHLLVARQVNDDVRLEALAVRALEIDLGLILAPFFQPGMFEHSLEDQFAPVTLGFLPFQCAGQVGGFVTQSQIELLQTLQLLGQREALPGFSLVALFDAFFKGLDALLQWVEQLPQALLTGFGKTLFTLIEDFPRQLGELRPKLVARALQVIEALLMAFLLFAQLCVERGGQGIQTTQFGVFSGAFDIPGVSGIAGIVTFDLQQFDFTAHGGKVGLLGGVGLAKIRDFIATGFKLGVQAILSQIRRGQALFQ